MSAVPRVAYPGDDGPSHRRSLVRRDRFRGKLSLYLVQALLDEGIMQVPEEERPTQPGETGDPHRQCVVEHRRSRCLRLHPIAVVTAEPTRSGESEAD